MILIRVMTLFLWFSRFVLRTVEWSNSKQPHFMPLLLLLMCKQCVSGVGQLERYLLLHSLDLATLVLCHTDFHFIFMTHGQRSVGPSTHSLIISHRFFFYSIACFKIYTHNHDELYRILLWALLNSKQTQNSYPMMEGAIWFLIFFKRIIARLFICN